MQAIPVADGSGQEEAAEVRHVSEPTRKPTPDALRSLEDVHPRLFLSPARLEQMREQIRGTHTSLWRHQVQVADAGCAMQTPVYRERDGWSGELQSYLGFYGAESLIITGYRSNICVLHTATTAARELKYRVVIPIDGMAALSQFEQDYTLFHFTVLPKQASERFAFTTLEMIGFDTAAAD